MKNLRFTTLSQAVKSKIWFGNPMLTMLLIVVGATLLWMAYVFLAGLLPVPYLYLAKLASGAAIFVGVLSWLKPFQMFPRVASIFRWYVWYCIFFIITDSLCHMVLYLTPFASIDLGLAHADALLGYHVPTILAWMHVHPLLNSLSWFVYNSLIIQLIILPLVLAILGDRKSFEIMMMVNLIISVLGAICFFFLPSNDPSDVEPSQYYGASQLDVVKQFNLVQHHIPNPFSHLGTISCPSFHTMWAIMITFALIRHRVIFIPLLIWNILLIISTLTTGWHFLVDVLAGIVLAALAITLASWLQRFSIEAPVVAKNKQAGGQSDWGLNIVAVLLLFVAVIMFVW